MWLPTFLQLRACYSTTSCITVCLLFTRLHWTTLDTFQNTSGRGFSLAPISAPLSPVCMALCPYMYKVFFSSFFPLDSVSCEAILCLCFPSACCPPNCWGWVSAVDLLPTWTLPGHGEFFFYPIAFFLIQIYTECCTVRALRMHTSLVVIELHDFNQLTNTPVIWLSWEKLVAWGFVTRHVKAKAGRTNCTATHTVWITAHQCSDLRSSDTETVHVAQIYKKTETQHRGVPSRCVHYVKKQSLPAITAQGKISAGVKY